MKPSEIEGLRVRLAQHDAEAALAAIPRLLQEREMLLEALRAVWDGGGHEMMPQAAYDLMRTALAKAES